MSQRKYTLKINIGFIWFGQMRRQLDGMVWEEDDFSYKESKGWLDRTFYCKGSARTINNLYRQFRDFSTRPRSTYNV